MPLCNKIIWKRSCAYINIRYIFFKDILFTYDHCPWTDKRRATRGTLERYPFIHLRTFVLLKCAIYIKNTS